MPIQRFIGLALAAAIGLAVAGCAATGHPIRGTVMKSDETFGGTASAADHGQGTITLTSSKGAKCKGTYRYIQIGEELKKFGGIMDFTCDDGRKGSVILSSGEKQMSGFGTVGDDIFLLED